MVRWLWLGCVLFCFTTTASGEEYVFRVDAIGYTDRPATEIAPTREILRTVEVIARPNVPFRAKAQLGKETVMFSGQLAPTNNGKLRAAIRYRQTAPLYGGEFQTTIDFTLGESVFAGGIISESEKLKSDVRHVLFLDRDQPADDREKPLTEERDNRLKDETKVASGEEYLLRLDTVGYIDQPAAEKAPKEMTIRSIEVIAVPDVPFRAKVQLGKETITFSGKLKPSENGTFTAAIRYRYRRETGNTVRIKNQVVPSLDETSLQTRIGITLGEAVLTGALKSRASQPDNPSVKSKIMHRLVLTKYKRADD